MGLFGGHNASAQRQIIVSLYRRIVEQARLPVFYIAHGVPDTPDGRFDMVMIHAFLVMRRLRHEGEAAAALSQALFDLMFDDMDQNLREMGVGDLGVGKRVKGMAKAFYGRVVAYEEGLDAKQDQGVLAEALRRNLYRAAAPREAQVAAVAAYMRQQGTSFDRMPFATLITEDWRFTVPMTEGDGDGGSCAGGSDG